MKYNTGIYQIVNLINGKRYIGSAIDLKERKYAHLSLLRHNKHYNNYLQRAYNKHKKENFKFEILLYCSKEDLLFYEQRAIVSYDLKKELYNILPTAGNCSGRKISNETKKKISESLKNHPVSMETKEKLRQANLGKKLSFESIKKTAEANRGRKHPHSEETKKKIGKAHKGKKLSEETRRRMSESRMGEKNCNFGKIFTKEHRLKLSIAKRGKKPSNYIYFSSDQIKEIKNLKKNNNIGIEKIAKKFACSKNTIRSRIKSFI